MTDISGYIKAVEERLSEIINDRAARRSDKTDCIKAMDYSLEAGGKRIRPVLTLMLCSMYGGDIADAVDPACAIEMIHTFSLIHDDMPCMDDDDMRRGKPSCHIAYGEANALLAGDGLENLAYDVIVGSSLPAQMKVDLMLVLTKAVDDMICGQSLDLLSETDKRELLDELYEQKTCALIRAACMMGYICSGKDKKSDMEKIDKFAYHLGMAFQIIDDILDVTADPSKLGKPVHSDEDNGKATYVSLYGTERAGQMALEHTAEAMAAAAAMPHSGQLCDLTQMLLCRDH